MEAVRPLKLLITSSSLKTNSERGCSSSHFPYIVPFTPKEDFYENGGKPWIGWFKTMNTSLENKFNTARTITLCDNIPPARFTTDFQQLDIIIKKKIANWVVNFFPSRDISDKNCHRNLRWHKKRFDMWRMRPVADLFLRAIPYGTYPDGEERWE